MLLHTPLQEYIMEYVPRHLCPCLSS
ncbi:hypothetical protein EE612_038190 [Oryza sativa]|nr:hypothetical protein EE612_038190 [Oryza sativa]